MRTRMILVAVTGLVAYLAIGSATVATAKLKKTPVTTTISLSVTNAPPGPGATFSGQVSAKGPSGCREGRTVTVSRIGPTATQSDGSYSILDPFHPEPGTYTAAVAKKVIKNKKKNKKFICTKAVSPPVAFP
jgi:hypothetical protein